MKRQLFVLLFLATLGASSAFDEFLPVERNIRDNKPRIIASQEDPFEESFEEFDLDLNDNVIRKREVSNDEALEGSGDDTPTAEEQSKSGQQNITTTLRTTLAANATSPSATATTINVETTAVPPADPTATTTVASTAKSSPALETTVPVENATAFNEFAVQKLHVEEKQKEIEAKPIESDKKLGTEKENAPEIQTPIHKEEIDKKQSGVAILASNADTATLEGSERTLGRMKPNENLKSAVADEPVPGESRPEGNKNDTKIIIFLFAGVIAVGAAAVTFNYIRKKKQGENEVSAVDRLNGDCAKSEDPEVGRELKPLMKNGEGEIRPPVAVEYKDEKAEAK